MKKDELKEFIQQNAPLIFEYINTVILKDIGVMHPSFFVKLVDDFFRTEQRDCMKCITVDTFSYFLIAEVLGESKHAYTFFRKETMTLDVLYKEVRVYYNYVRFAVKEDFFCIDLVQTKAGVTAFEEEMIKFSKKFPMKLKGIEEFIEENRNRLLKESLKKIKEDMNTILK